LLFVAANRRTRVDAHLHLIQKVGKLIQLLLLQVHQYMLQPEESSKTNMNQHYVYSLPQKRIGSINTDDKWM